jgi:signal transduction histidine kinase
MKIHLILTMRFYIVTLLTFILPSFFISQNVDSLISILPNLKGKEKVQTLADIGYYLSSNQIDKAIYYGNLSVLEAKQLKDSSLIAACMNDLSVSYYYKGSFDSCIYLAEKAYEMRIRLNETRNAGASISKAALGYYEKGKYDISLEKNLMAIDLFNKAGAFVEAGKLQNNIGNIYERNMQRDKATEMFLKASENCLKGKDYEGYVQVQCNYADILRKSKKIEEARKIYVEMLELCTKYCREEYLAQIYQHLGVVERSLGHIQAGLDYYLNAKAVYDRIGSLSGSSIININIGNCYNDLKQFGKAEEFLTLGLNQARELKSWLWQKNAFLGLYEMYTYKGDYKTANTYLEYYQEVNDSMYSERMQDKIGELQTKYEVAEKENTILNQKVQLSGSELAISKRNTQIFVLIGVLLLVLLIAGVLFQRNKIKRKESEVAFQRKVQSERTRISRDLHDNMGAELSIVSSQLDIKASGIANKNDQKDIELISDQVRKASALMRDTIWTVSMEKISVEQLGLKIKEFAERTFNGKQVSIHFENTNLQWHLSPEHTLNIYRICQEVTNNASKYSQCRNFHVNIFNAGESVIELRDDGIGFDESKVEKGYGLNNLKTRALEMNAELIMRSEPGKGTMYKLRLSKDALWK